MSFLDDYREVLFAGLSGHTRKNYDNVITEVETACDKKIFLVDASDVEQIRENLDKYHYWTSDSKKTWVKSTEQLKISCIIAVGRRLESLFISNSEYNTEFFQRFGFHYKSPFDILKAEKTNDYSSPKTIKDEVGKKYTLQDFEKLFEVYDDEAAGRMIKRYPQMGTVYIAQSRVIIALITVAGISSAEVQKIKFEDLLFVEDEVYIQTPKKVYWLSPFVKKLLVAYLHTVYGMEFLKLPYLFANYAHNCIGQPDIRRIIEKYNKNLDVWDLQLFGEMYNYVMIASGGNSKYNLSKRKKAMITRKLRMEKKEMKVPYELVVNTEDGKNIEIQIEQKKPNEQLERLLMNFWGIQLIEGPYSNMKEIIEKIHEKYIEKDFNNSDIDLQLKNAYELFVNKA